VTLTPHIPSDTCPTCGTRADRERFEEPRHGVGAVEHRYFPCDLEYRAWERFNEWLVEEAQRCILSPERKRERAELNSIYIACVAVVDASELPNDRKQISRDDLDRIFSRRSIPTYYPDRYRQKT
jgi:hypothetical protein